MSDFSVSGTGDYFNCVNIHLSNILEQPSNKYFFIYLFVSVFLWCSVEFLNPNSPQKKNINK